ncbi:hypothetical protein CCAX7_56770 [Capsulimonas corticalis]|uniref:Uncharacterized protein n=1 Tax=Capsulimonas corticalis TaxID=2219043 RepID=A0A402D0E3_9BACT|nr:hypothetical protein [Capsulimonas corticalis]BDI33626.1 hypothetical protein CCAX7_56770 [Capsulimonas corticalis]
MMDPGTLIVTALAFAGPELAKGALSEAAKNAYASLKELLHKHFAGDEEAESALKHHEKKPQAYEAILKDAILQAGLDKNEEVLKQAKALLAAADPSGTAQGKYNVAISGGQGNQVGDGNTQTNTFGASPTSQS